MYTSFGIHGVLESLPRGPRLPRPGVPSAGRNPLPVWTSSSPLRGGHLCQGKAFGVRHPVFHNGLSTRPQRHSSSAIRFNSRPFPNLSTVAGISPPIIEEDNILSGLIRCNGNPFIFMDLPGQKKVRKSTGARYCQARHGAASSFLSEPPRVSAIAPTGAKS